jgi:hypothetical protein
MTTPTAALTPEHIARIVEAARVIAGREPVEIPEDEASTSAWCVYCHNYDNHVVFNETTEDLDFVINHAETCPWAVLVAAIGSVG